MVQDVIPQERFDSQLEARALWQASEVANWQNVKSICKMSAYYSFISHVINKNEIIYQLL